MALRLQRHPSLVVQFLFQVHLLHPFLFLLLLSNAHVPTSVQALLPHRPAMNTVDLKALVAIKNSLTDASPTDKFFSSWDLTSPDPCSTFAGVTCALYCNAVTACTLRVATLTLGNAASGSTPLAGSLSNAISVLSELTQLILSPGMVTGPIPFLLGRLTKLRVISLSNNRFTGPIPVSLSFLTNLHTLDLSRNQLTGSIPPGLMDLPQLKILILSSNSLTGDLPAMSAQFIHLDLKANQLTGPLPSPSPSPSRTSLPTSLRYLSLSQNRMVGPINGLESLSHVEFLDLSMNGFSGPIPAQLFCIPTLTSLFLQRNSLSGWIPQYCSSGPAISSLYGVGSTVDLSHNLLTGQLSTLLAGVESLYLNSNRLIGTVPEEYVKSMYDGRTKTLYLQHNYLTGLPMEGRGTLPDTASFCASYNCMAVLPIGGVNAMACPANSGAQISRPIAQCSVFNNGSSSQFDEHLE